MYWDRKKVSAKVAKISNETNEVGMPVPSTADERYGVTLDDAVDLFALGHYGFGENAATLYCRSTEVGA